MPPYRDAHDRQPVPRRPRPVQPKRRGLFDRAVGAVTSTVGDIVRSPLDVLQLGMSRDHPSRFVPARVAQPRHVRRATAFAVEQSGMGALDRVRRGQATPADYLMLLGLGVGAANPMLRAFGGRTGQAMTRSPYIQGPLGDFAMDVGRAYQRARRFEERERESRRPRRRK